MSSGRAVKVVMRTSPRMPLAPAMRPSRMRLSIPAPRSGHSLRSRLLGLGGGRRRALDVELDAVGAVLGQQRVVGADLLDIAAVARRGRVGHHDEVVGPLLGAP